MRLAVLGDLAQTPPKSVAFAYARVLTGDRKPYQGVPVKVSFPSQPDRYATTVTSDQEGFVFYPSAIGDKVVFTPVAREGYYFDPVDVSQRIVDVIESGAFDPSVRHLVFTEVEGSPFSWRPYLIGAGVLLAAYYVWDNFKK